MGSRPGYRAPPFANRQSSLDHRSHDNTHGNKTCRRCSCGCASREYLPRAASGEDIVRRRQCCTLARCSWLTGRDLGHIWTAGIERRLSIVLGVQSPGKPVLKPERLDDWSQALLCARARVPGRNRV